MVGISKMNIMFQNFTVFRAFCIFVQFQKIESLLTKLHIKINFLQQMKKLNLRKTTLYQILDCKYLQIHANLRAICAKQKFLVIFWVK